MVSPPSVEARRAQSQGPQAAFCLLSGLCAVLVMGTSAGLPGPWGGGPGSVIHCVNKQVTVSLSVEGGQEEHLRRTFP